MFLSELHRDAEILFARTHPGLPYPPAGYRWQTLRHVLDTRHDADHVTWNTEPVRSCLPFRERSSNIAPVLLVDNAKYVLGIDPADRLRARIPTDRFPEHRAAFRNLVRRCYETVGDPLLLTVLAFLERWNPERPEIDLPEDLKPTDRIAFRVDGHFPQDLPAVRNFWYDCLRQPRARRMICLVTGKPASVEPRLPVSLRNVPGAQPSGAALSSLNAEAFRSHNLGEFSAPIGRDAAERTALALESLLDSETHAFTLGDWDRGIRYVAWSPEGAVPAARRLLVGHAAETGTPLPPEAPCFLIGLSCHSGGRIVFRSGFRLTAAELEAAEQRWNRLTAVPDPWNDLEAEPLPVSRITEAAFPTRADVPNALYDAMVACALTDTPPPNALLPRALRRCQVGYTPHDPGAHPAPELVPRPLAALFKLLLAARPETSALHDATSDAARLGRLFSQLERTAAARGDYRFAQRRLAHAMTRPRDAFAARMPEDFDTQYPLAPHHPLPHPLPETLTPEQQAAFALGYFAERTERHFPNAPRPVVRVPYPPEQRERPPVASASETETGG
ncbi:MAG: type I-C CRISPR-associated protein Cas8c/Csd1 [Capsulimonadales bacterium]|nr:type I-C CRISPR-associated protein Cas8c/Csd1 [Capsulimonadales bacterium]